MTNEIRLGLDHLVLDEKETQHHVAVAAHRHNPEFLDPFLEPNEEGAEALRPLLSHIEVGPATAAAAAGVDAASGEEDLTQVLPDELLLMILKWVVDLRGCPAVCRRWNTVCQDPALRYEIAHARWFDYAAQNRHSQQITKGTGVFFSSAVEFLAYKQSHKGAPPSLAAWDARIQGASGVSMHFRDSSRGKCMAIVGNDGLFIVAPKPPPQEKGLKGIEVYDSSRTLLRVLDNSTEVCMQSLAVGADGTLFGVSDLDGASVHSWNPATGEYNGVFGRANGTPSVLAIVSTRKDEFVCATMRLEICVWSNSTRELLHTLEGHTDVIEALAVGIRGELVSASQDATVRVWDVASGSQLRLLTGFRDPVYTVTIDSFGTIFTISTEVSEDEMFWAFLAGEPPEECILRVWRDRSLVPEHEIIGNTDFIHPFGQLVVGATGHLYNTCLVSPTTVW